MGPISVLFDTNIIIDFLIGVAAAETELNRNPPNHISIVTWIEVMAGSEYQAQDTRTVLANFTVLPLTQPIAERAAVLRRERRTLKLPDAIILATAQVHARILITRNTRDFDPADAAIHIPTRFRHPYNRCMATLYADALDHLQTLGQELAPGTRRKWDLAHMRTLAHALGDPQTRFPSILIAGTNGKGSTAATLASILTAAGYRTALYTSPHLVRVNERIQIDGTEIPDDDFARLYFHADDTATRLVSEGALPHPPSFFEVLTAVAFLYFAESKVDIAILEAGLGGRLDATNIVDPLLSILTDIALDHQEYLGPTIAAITREKCGILRDGGTLITLPQHAEANQAIGEAAATLNLHALSAANFIPPATSGRLPTNPGAPSSPASSERVGDALLLTPNRYTLTLDHEPLEVDSPLPGHHQQRNIALAIAAAHELRTHHNYNICNTLIAKGIANTKWPGRLELLPSSQGAPLLLDVAHNPAGAWTLRAALAQLPETQPRTLLFSCLRDKSLEEMSRILFPLFDSSPDGDPARRRDHLILAPIDNPRATTVEDLLAAAHALQIPAHAAPHLAGALAQARAATPADGLIVATGSVYLVGALRALTA